MSSAYAQTSVSAIQLLDAAENEFEKGNIGTALKLTENAKEKRVSESKRYIEILDSALTPLAVQNAGDQIPDVREVLVSRLESHAVAVIDEALLLHDAEYFNNSITEIKAYYINHSVYPEAEFLLGRIYQAEGEYEIARDFYFSSLTHAYALDVPTQINDIYYQTAYLAELLNDEDLYETMLLNILDANPWFTQGNGLSPYLKAAIDNAKKLDSATTFFRLYRANHPASLKAAIQLSVFYQSKNHFEESYNFAVLGSLLAFTRLYEVLEYRDQRFVYTDFSSFIGTCMKYPDIINWFDDQLIWNCFYQFAVLSKNNGNTLFADEIFPVLSKYSRNEEIRKLAVRQM